MVSHSIINKPESGGDRVPKDFVSMDSRSTKLSFILLDLAAVFNTSTYKTLLSVGTHEYGNGLIPN